MKVFMLGWEFPPYISGGVGAACQGLTQALLDVGADVLFMLPRPVKMQTRPRVKVVRQMLPAVSPPPPAVNGMVPSRNGSHKAAAVSPASSGSAADPAPSVPQTTHFPYIPQKQTRVHHERMRILPADALLSPYLTAEMYREILIERAEMVEMGVTPPLDPPPSHAATPAPAPAGQHQAAPPSQPTSAQPEPAPMTESPVPPPPPAPPQYIEQTVEVMEEYAPSLLDETHRYSRIALAVAGKESFDVVHAHDWMTFEAARVVADSAGAPLVVQIHSTEYDRAPYGPDPMIVGTEKAGMEAADAVIAVSQRTKQMLVERYGIEADKIHVIYNAVDCKDEVPAPAAQAMFTPRGKLVLFLGRITAQKGPEHFLAAARKVLAVYEDVKFVMAGEGDRRLEMEKLAEDLGIGEKVMFTGFLSKPEVETLFKTADVYVMPSVSEPFGLVSLEALRNDVPVILSKQSGVAELLHHVLKVDFWDIDDLANKILAVLRHPSLATTLRIEGQNEVRQLTWHDAARQTVEVYESLFLEPVEAVDAATESPASSETSPDSPPAA